MGINVRPRAGLYRRFGSIGVIHHQEVCQLSRQDEKGSYPVLKLGADTAVASSHVRLLGVDIALDLSVDRHVSRVCAGCLYL